MSAPSFRRASPSPRPSSVQLWLLRHPIVFFALFAVASSTSNICGANFGNQMHTIGPVGGGLWAITKDNWTVYKLSPCNVENDSLSHCMVVGSPVSLDSKWPELAKSVKVAANKTDYELAFDNSIIGYSSSFNDTVLALHLYNNVYFGFLFGSKNSITTQGVPNSNHEIYKGSWISSDQKGKVYRILRSGKRDPIILRKINDPDAPEQLQIDSKLVFEENICNVSTEDDVQVQFSNVSCTTGEMTFNVSRGVLYRNQFYLFGSDKVYIFLDKSDKTKLVELSYETFFPCKKPTTTLVPSTHSNVTKAPRTTVTGEHMSTTAKGMKPSTILIIVILAIIVLLVIGGVGYYLYPKKDTETKVDNKIGAGTKAKAKFSGKDMSQSKAKVSSVGSRAASKVGAKSSSKIGSKT